MSSDSGFCRSLRYSVTLAVPKLLAMAAEQFAIVPVEEKTTTTNFKLPTPIPMPPFKPNAKYTPKTSVPCFWVDENGACTRCRQGYFSLWQHMMKDHTNYLIPPEWQRTYFKDQVNKERTESRRATKTKAKACAVSSMQGETDGVKTDNAVEAIVECSQDSSEITYVLMPGSAATIWLPPGVGADLVASGYLLVKDNGNTEWNPKVQVGKLRNQILAVMPQGRQRDHLKNKFGTAKASPAQAVQPRQIVFRPDTTRQMSLDNFFEVDATSKDVFMEMQRQMLAELQACVKALTSSDPKAAPQALKIKDKFKTWEKPDGWDDAKRRGFPFDVEEIPDKDLVADFDAFMESNMLREKTRNKHHLGLSRFSMLFETTDESPLDYKNIVLNVSRSKLFDKVQALKIMAPDYSCTMVNVFR